MINAAALLLAATVPFHGVFVELEHAENVCRSDARVVIIANIVGYGEGCSPCRKFEKAATVLEVMPKETEVYVGLVYEANFESDKATKAQLQNAWREDRDVAIQFLDYLKERKIDRRPNGWYLAREVHNFDDLEQRKLIRDEYLEPAADALPDFGAVLIAPYFVTGCDGSATLKATETGAMFAELVKNTKITHLLLQDGFSARFDHLCDTKLSNYTKAAERYEQKIAEAVRAEGVQFWIDMEVFDYKEPAEVARIKKQRKIVPPNTPIVAYRYDDCRAKKLNAAVCPER